MRLLDRVLGILEGGTAFDVVRHLLMEQLSLGRAELFVDPEEPDTESWELFWRALNRFQLAECEVSEVAATVAAVDGESHRLAHVEAAGPVYGHARADGATPVAGVLGAVLFDTVEHLRAVHAGAADDADAFAGVTAVNRLGWPDCELARRLGLDVSPLLGTNAVIEEVVFLVTSDDRLLVLEAHPLAKLHGDAHTGILGRLRDRVLVGAGEVAERLVSDPDGPTDVDEFPSGVSEPARTTVADVAAALDEHGTSAPVRALLAGHGGPLDGTPTTLFSAHPLDEYALGLLARVADGLEAAASDCRLTPVDAVSTTETPYAVVVSVAQQWRLPCRPGGPSEPPQPAAILGMELWGTAEQLRGIQHSEAAADDSSHVATVRRALDSLYWFKPSLARTQAERHVFSPAVELVWAVVPGGFDAASDGDAHAAVVAMSHDPLVPAPASEAVDGLLADLRRRALVNAAAEFATLERDRGASHGDLHGALRLDRTLSRLAPPGTWRARAARGGVAVAGTIWVSTWSCVPQLGRLEVVNVDDDAGATGEPPGETAGENTPRAP